jgi:hypothetical protein
MSKMTGKAVNIHTSGFTFPGQSSGYCWEFPTIKISKRIKTGSNYMTWTIYAGIMELGTNDDIMKIFANEHVGGKPNPDYVAGFGFKDFAILLRDEYFEHRPIEIVGKELCGFTVVDSHHGDSPQSFGVVTKITAGKNLGKKNATNIFTQAMRKALGLYNNRLNEELQLNKNIILPMLASGEGKSVAEMADFIEAKLKTDSKLICQYKYDGIRMMAKIAAPNDALADIAYPNGLICYSRSGKKIFIAENLQAELLRLLHGKKAILDGELYIHGVHLNDITGYVRREDDCAEKQLLDYYVFDFYVPEATCEARLRSLARFNMASYNKIKIVPGVELASAAAIMDYYNSAINSGYEGLILRRPNAQYEPGDNDHHSKNMIKLKPLIRDEYECVGYNIGTGKCGQCKKIFSQKKN